MSPGQDAHHPPPVGIGRSVQRILGGGAPHLSRSDGVPCLLRLPLRVWTNEQSPSGIWDPMESKPPPPLRAGACFYYIECFYSLLAFIFTIHAKLRVPFQFVPPVEAVRPAAATKPKPKAAPKQLSMTAFLKKN